MPAVQDETGGFRLLDVELATNKLLALAGRDEVRDYVGVLDAHERVLPLGAPNPPVWAAGPSPGLYSRPSTTAFDRLVRHYARGPLALERLCAPAGIGARSCHPITPTAC